MLPSPRVVVIDDEQKHLDGLTDGLNRHGTACLPIHFTGETASIPPCPHARVIFADLHLGSGTRGDHTQDFSTLGGLIEDTIRPFGPYLIVLWTMYPEQSNKLSDFLNDRLQHVPKPFVVQALAKQDHLDPEGGVKSTQALVEAIEKIAAENPQVTALLNWEERAQTAAASTVSSILELAKTTPVNMLLARLAAATVGKEHVEEDRFRAVNEALLPILDDHIAAMRSRETDNKLWQAAFKEADTEGVSSLSEAARLNRLLHIAPATSANSGTERGTVIDLPQKFHGNAFEPTFELAEGTAANKQFWCKELKKNAEAFNWVLIQTQAACDYAQTQPGPLPFHLGLFLPKENMRTGKPPEALWTSPCFEFNSTAYVLHVNARFQLSLPSAQAAKIQPLFRLREQLLNDLIYRLHSYGARPGIVSFPSQ